MSRLDLTGKVAIITGGAAGIGRSIATALAEEGVSLTIADIDAQAAHSTVQQLEQVNPAATYIPIETDVTDPASVAAMVEGTLEQFGKIDILVNNAGINVPRLLVDPAGKEELDEATFDKITAVNQKGIFLCAQAVAREMISRGEGGVIVNMTSEAGLEGSEGQSAYAGSKGAIYVYTRSWAKELGKYDIRVVGCAPAIVERTALRSAEYEKSLAYIRGITVEQLHRSYEEIDVPLGRVGRLEEVADLVCFLASDMASYITGTVVNISGGKSRG